MHNYTSVSICFLSLVPCFAPHCNLYIPVIFLGTQVLQGLDAVIASHRSRGGGGGYGTQAVMFWVGRQDERAQGRPVEGRESSASTKTPSCFYGGCQGMYSCTRKRRGVGVGGGGEVQSDGES